MNPAAKDMTLTLDSRVKHRENLLLQEIEGATVMADTESGFYYGVEEIGQRIWQLTNTSIEVAELCRILRNEYEVDAEQCEGEVLDFLNELRVEGLLTASEA